MKNLKTKFDLTGSTFEEDGKFYGRMVARVCTTNEVIFDKVSPPCDTLIEAEDYLIRGKETALQIFRSNRGGEPIAIFEVVK